MSRRLVCLGVTLFMTLGLNSAAAASVADEESGQSPDPTVAPAIDPGARATAWRQLPVRPT